MKDTPETWKPEEGHQWERGWEEHETFQRRRMSRLPLSEKLQWLEDAQRTVRNLRANRPSAAGRENSRKT